MAKATTSKTESLTVRVPVDLMAELRQEADRRSTGLSVIVLERLRHPVADRPVSVADVFRPVMVSGSPRPIDFPARPVQQRGAGKKGELSG